MNFLFDEDASVRLARAMRTLGEPVQYVQTHPDLGKGTPDDVVFRVAEEGDYYIVSRDRSMKSRPHQLAAIKKRGLGVFFLHLGKKETPPLWEQVKLVVKRWEEIKAFADSNSRPFTAGVYRSKRVTMWK